MPRIPIHARAARMSELATGPQAIHAAAEGTEIGLAHDGVANLRIRLDSKLELFPIGPEIIECLSHRKTPRHSGVFLPKAIVTISPRNSLYRVTTRKMVPPMSHTLRLRRLW